MPWLTGDDIPTETICLKVVIPDDPTFRRAFRGAIMELTKPENWEEFGTLTPDEQASAFLLALLIQQECEPVAFVGEVKAFATANIPAGWLLCEGQEAHRVTYAALFAEIGDVFGAGNGTTTFNLPDLRGTTIIGTGRGSGYKTQILGAAVGEDKHTLTTGELPIHAHPGVVISGIQTPGRAVVATGGAANVIMSGSTGSAGSDTPHNNMPPSLPLNVAIYAGVG